MPRARAEVLVQKIIPTCRNSNLPRHPVYQLMWLMFMHTSLNHCCPANMENKSLLAGADGAGGTWVLNASVSPLFLTSQTQKEFGMYQNGPACKFHLALKLSHEEQLTALHMHGREQPLCPQLGSRWQPAGQALEWQPVLAALPKLADLPSASLGRARPAPSSLLIKVLDQSPAKQSHTQPAGETKQH